MSATQQLKTLTPAQYAFVKWLYAKHPNVARAAEQHHASLNGFMDSLTTTFNTIVEKAPDLMKQYVTGKTQLEELKINLQRAKAGQYPLDTASGSYYNPQQFGMPAPAGVPLLAWIAGGALLAFLILRK